ncbi:MAG: extracellular solute-binding protein [Chloroflexi bacterium]|nr:extracellular solute-binding protein [Chloroflexota bacterium]
MYRVGCAGGRQKASRCALPTGEKNGPHHHQLGCFTPDASSRDGHRRIRGIDRCRVWRRLRIPIFMKANPSITVDVELVPSAELITKLQTMAASDTLPDNGHSYLGTQSYHNFALGKAFIDIESYIARDKMDLKQWFPALVELMRIDGKLYGLPYKGQVLGAGFYYNIDLFEKGGVAVPTDAWTTDDLVKAAQRLTVRQGNDTSQFGYSIQTWGGENLTAHLRAFGADPYSDGGKKSTLDSPAALEAFQWYENLFQRERVMGAMGIQSPATARHRTRRGNCSSS